MSAGKEVSKPIKVEVFQTSQELKADWLSDPPERTKRSNNPQAADGAGARLSQFNFE
jgi:hypothetical protein